MRIRTMMGLPLLVAVLLGACGGGGRVAGGGTGGTGISMGTVTGFGSVFVNGIEYQTNDATRITVDGAIIPEAEHKQKLDLGMVVKVDATRSRNGNIWTAKSIEYRSDLIGPAEEVNAATGAIIMLSKTVSVKSNTTFAGWNITDPVDGSTTTPTLVDLPAGAAVKVTGFPDFNGNITATRIEWDGSTMWDASIAVEMRGKVGVVSNATEFRFDGPTGMKVSHDGTTTLSQGDYVRVVGNYDRTAIAAIKTVELEDRTFGQYDDEFEIEGMIQHIEGTRIMVLGYEIDIASVRNPPKLAVGDLVEVEGEEFDRGVLIADEIEIKHLSDMELRVKVQAHDSVAKTVTMLGRAFHITASTVIEDKADFFERLRDGVTVIEVDAYQEVTGDYIVTEVEFKDYSSTAKIEGRVESADPATSTLLISGITVNVSGAAIPGGSVDGLVGEEVEIRGSEDGVGGINATRVELDD